MRRIFVRVHGAKLCLPLGKLPVGPASGLVSRPSTLRIHPAQLFMTVASRRCSTIKCDACVARTTREGCPGPTVSSRTPAQKEKYDESAHSRARHRQRSASLDQRARPSSAASTVCSRTSCEFTYLRAELERLEGTRRHDPQGRALFLLNIRPALQVFDQPQCIINRRMRIASRNRITDPEQLISPLWVGATVLRQAGNEPRVIHCTQVE